MRASAVVFLALVACGGSTPPPETPSSDTSSLEAKSAPSKDSPDDSAPGASSAPAAASPVASSAAPAAADAPAAPAAFHPTPSSTGAIDGKPFSPKVAQVIGPMKKDGRILLSLTEATDCPAPGDAKGDHPVLTLLVPWSDGYKVDLASLKAGKKGPGEIAFSRGKKDVSTTFKPSGSVTVVSAPMEKGATGKLKIDLQSGDFMLAGALDVEVCVSPK